MVLVVLNISGQEGLTRTHHKSLMGPTSVWFHDYSPDFLLIGGAINADSLILLPHASLIF